MHFSHQFAFIGFSKIQKTFLHSKWMKIRDINASNFIWPLWAIYQNSFGFKVLFYYIREIIIIYNIVRHCEVYQLYKVRVYRQFVKLGIDWITSSQMVSFNEWETWWTSSNIYYLRKYLAMACLVVASWRLHFSEESLA